MKIWTASQIKNRNKCSKFDSEGKNSKPVMALERGNIIHEMLEKGVDNVNKEYSVYRGKKKPYQLEHNWAEYERITKMAKDDFPQYFGEEWIAEMEITEDIGRGYIISGILDNHKVVGDKAIVIDWKTGISRANLANPMDVVQGAMYGLLIFYKYPQVNEVTFSFVYIEGFEEITLSWNREDDLVPLWHSVTKYIEIAQSTGYKTGKHCDYCVNRSTCPLMNQYTHRLDTLSYKEARALKKTLEDIMKTKKEEYDRQAEESGDYSMFKSYSKLYVYREDLDEESRKMLLNDTVTVSREKALLLAQKGIPIHEKQTRRLKV